MRLSMSPSDVLLLASMINLCKTESSVQLTFMPNGCVKMCSLIMGNSACVLASTKLTPVGDSPAETVMVDTATFIDGLKHIATSVRTHNPGKQIIEVADTHIEMTHSVDDRPRAQVHMQTNETSTAEDDAVISEADFASNFGLQWSIHADVNRAQLETALRGALSPKQTGVKMEFKANQLIVTALFDNTQRKSFVPCKLRQHTMQASACELTFSVQCVKLCHAALCFIEQDNKSSNAGNMFATNRPKGSSDMRFAADADNPLLATAESEKCSVSILIGPKLED